MGYYVRTTNTNFFLAKENFEQAHQLMCSLNQHDEMKRGGSWGGDGVTADSPRPAGMDHHPARWFSWLSADYPKEHPTFESLMTALDFQVSFDDDGNVTDLAYDNKSGQEELFLNAIAPLVKEGSYIGWQGEDGEMWVNVFKGGVMVTDGRNLNNAYEDAFRQVVDSLLG